MLKVRKRSLESAFPSELPKNISDGLADLRMPKKILISFCRQPAAPVSAESRSKERKVFYLVVCHYGVTVEWH